ncbi:MAG TPA: lysophospholipid acyltransferase family protein [Acidimicrobiia bacterium]|jgi:1-acyl-sn-glycerol-3-phosphate acyltransferase|nr:lysophospholipid acyltransferase family protein [Acidimicrobiia bacterium]
MERSDTRNTAPKGVLPSGGRGDGNRFGARRSSPGSFTEGLVALVRYPIEALARWVLDLHITGRENLPDGAYVMAANHLSFIDPVMVTLAARRNVRYLAVASLFDQHHLFDRLITFFGAIPTPRDRLPIGAMRTAIKELQAGRPLGLFPEGRRVSHWRETPAERGAAWLALITGSPLVPVAMHGTQGTLSIAHRSFKRASVRIWVEEPLDPDDFLAHADPLEAMMAAWAEAVGRRLDPWWENAAADSLLRDTDH